MKLNRRATKVTQEDIGGLVEPTDEISAFATALEEEVGLYAPVSPLPLKHSAKYLTERLKLRRLAEERLIHLSDELLKLATEVRYLDPLVAELLDEAWISADTALSLVEEK